MDNAHNKAQNVVSMSEYQPESGFRALSQVETYWEALRGSKLVPCRADVDPRGIDNALAYSFILERVAPGIARLRVAGTHLNALMGMEVRGMPLTSMFAPTDRRIIADALEEVFQAPAVSQFTLLSDGGIGRPTLEARMVLLPLKSDLGDVSRALGCLVSADTIGAAPRRFDVISHTLRPLVETDGIARPPNPLPETRPAREQPGFAETPSKFTTSGNKKRPPYLRLVKSDD